MKMSIAHSGFFHQLINKLCFEKWLEMKNYCNKEIIS